MQIVRDSAGLREAPIRLARKGRDDRDHPSASSPLTIDLIDRLRQIRLGLQYRAAEFEHYDGRIHATLQPVLLLRRRRGLAGKRRRPGSGSASGHKKTRSPK